MLTVGREPVDLSSLLKLIHNFGSCNILTTNSMWGVKQQNQHQAKVTKRSPFLWRWIRLYVTGCSLLLCTSWLLPTLSIGTILSKNHHNNPRISRQTYFPRASFLKTFEIRVGVLSVKVLILTSTFCFSSLNKLVWYHLLLHMQRVHVSITVSTSVLPESSRSLMFTAERKYETFLTLHSNVN